MTTKDIPICHFNYRDLYSFFLITKGNTCHRTFGLPYGAAESNLRFSLLTSINIYACLTYHPSQSKI